MELFRPRPSSIPRHYGQMPAQERFSVTDAAQLKLALQALDDKLQPGVDVAILRNACKSRPFHEEIYVDGSEDFFLVVKSIARPDLIPHVCIDAYATLQQGRYPHNHYKVSDLRKGVDPTFSEVRRLLRKIDPLCGTKLDASFRALEDRVKPFPFLKLSAELALHVYSYLLPREPHIALMYQPTREHKPPRIRLDIMRANRQIHDEVRKYFYENRILFMLAARDKDSLMLSNEYISRYYETLAVMNPQTRMLFNRLEVMVGHLTHQVFRPRQYQLVPSVADPMRHVIQLLPKLSTVVIAMGPTPLRPIKAVVSVATQRNDTLEWLLDHIPQHMEILWEQTTVPTPSDKWDDSGLWNMMRERGSFLHGTSTTARLEARRHKLGSSTTDIIALNSP
ncbi:hypothetical protein BDU57DRAFT_140034 [Ampelomyces quisqualis]|uniref:Uncharacterized protein n=1 Tax=Ampelomyces quisqualis TaxID=50730 RepID=A0A6A5QVF1_AMPQU|nr:hypothetical protein BDU57DRAFT_140034 [Ampelomyces quisqualis]